MLVLAADHLLRDQEAFTNSVLEAVPLAESGSLVTFGVVPTEPHVGYGYIEAGRLSDGAYSVLSFKEKPDLKTASRYVSEEDIIGIVVCFVQG